MSEPSAKNEVSSSSNIHKPTDGSQTTLSQDTSTTSDVSNDLVISFQNIAYYVPIHFLTCAADYFLTDRFDNSNTYKHCKRINNTKMTVSLRK